MIAEKKSKDSMYIKTIMMLKALRDKGKISVNEFNTMYEYYKKTYAPDIVMI